MVMGRGVVKIKDVELIKKLRKLGVVVGHKTNHYNLEYNGKQYQIKRHPSKDFPNTYFAKILKFFDIKG